MVEKKLLGDKTKGGFYRKGKDGSVETLDPKTLEYRPRGGDKEIRAKCKELAQIEDPRERVRKLFADDGKAGQLRVEGALAIARVLGAPHRRDHRRHRRRSMTRCAGATTGSSAPSRRGTPSASRRSSTA